MYLVSAKLIRVFLLALAPVVASCVTYAYDAVSPQGDSLGGYWKLNEELSDDVQKLLQERFEEEAEERSRRIRAVRRSSTPVDPSRGPQGDTGMMDEAVAMRPPPRRRSERIQRILGISRTLHITQEGAKVEIASDVETRRFEGGSRSQVSMPGGGLADSRVGWQRQWFVIDRRVRQGIHVTERYRWLKDTDQLESSLVVKGDDFLGGMKIKRIYDRVRQAPEPRNPAFGPVP